MATIGDIVVDCRHPASLARFWAAVLDDHEIAPYDAAELARLRADGIDDPEDDPTVLLLGSPRVWFQLVPEGSCFRPVAGPVVVNTHRHTCIAHTMPHHMLTDWTTDRTTLYWLTMSASCGQ